MAADIVIDRPQTTPAPRNAIWAWILITALIAAAYANSFSVPFIFDDRLWIAENFGNTSGRPVYVLSFALNRFVWGTAPWSYHVVNVFIHLITALLLFGVVRRTLSIGSRHVEPEGETTLLATITATMWAILPLHTVTITYVSQRSEALMACFLVLAVYATVRAESSQRSAWYAVAAVSCALGMSTKQTMAGAPMVVLLYDRTFLSRSFGSAIKHHWKLYVGLALSWLILGFCMVGIRSQDVGYGMGVSPLVYAMTESKALVIYAVHSIWPGRFVFDYGPVFLRSLPSAFPYVVVIVTAAIGVCASIRVAPAVAFLGGCFFVLLAPTSSVVPITTQPIAESRSYLPSFAIVVILAVALKTMMGRKALVPGTFAAVALVGLTLHRNMTYRNEISLWNATAAAAPDNPRAHYCLGVALANAGKFAAAKAEYEQALRIDQDYSDAHTNLANLLVNEGSLNEAMLHYQTVLRAHPNIARVQNDYGGALARSGHIPEALQHMREAVRLSPEDSDFHYNLAIIANAAGQKAEARAQCERALALDPAHAAASRLLSRLQSEGEVR